MPNSLSFYLNKTEKLRVNRNLGRVAPHKPILLLAVIDLIEQGVILENKIEPAPPIVEGFLRYWNLLSLEKPRIFLPFYHLQSDGFWHLHAKPGKEELLKLTRQVSSMAQLAGIVRFASLNEDLFILLHRADAREAIRQKIIEVYFLDRSELFRAAINENREINVIENLLLEGARKAISGLAAAVGDKPKRNIAFRRAIVRLYDYTCAACRLRIITLDGETAVEAAHIYPFAQSYDDSIGNGLALCPLHHWSFDRGLFSIDDGYKMIVSTGFEESGNEALLLQSLRSKEIYLPKEKPFRPALTMIRWHREKKFVL